MDPASERLAGIAFGRFQVLPDQRDVLADGRPVKLGGRAFDMLMALIEARGAVVSKETLMARVWPGIVVCEQNLKVQISALRKALGADRNLISTEFGRGYRFIGILRSNATVHACRGPRGARLRVRRALPPQNCWQSLQCGFNSSR